MSINPSAVERLQRSRACLLNAMGNMAIPAGQSEESRAGPSTSGWRAALMQNPGTRLVLELGRAWWARQPLRLVMPLVEQSARVLLAPTAQRHPLGLVLGAATLGAALVWVRPWRWLSATALLAKFLPPLLLEIAKHTPADFLVPATSTISPLLRVPPASDQPSSTP